MKRHTLQERIRDETCQRFMAWSEWDQKAGIPHYRGIALTMVWMKLRFLFPQPSLRTHPNEVDA